MQEEAREANTVSCTRSVSLSFSLSFSLSLSLSLNLYCNPPFRGFDPGSCVCFQIERSFRRVVPVPVLASAVCCDVSRDKTPRRLRRLLSTTLDD